MKDIIPALTAFKYLFTPHGVLGFWGFGVLGGWGLGVMVKIIAFGRLAYNSHHTYYFALLGKDVFCILVILKTH